MNAKTYSITFDYNKGETNPLILLSNITKILQSLDNLNNTMCKNIDSDIQVSPCLIDIEKGSIKLILADMLNSISDEALKEGDYKKLIGHFLFKTKHLIIKKLNLTKQMPQPKREKEIINVIEREYNNLPNNELINKEINKTELLQAINDLSKTSKNIQKVSFNFEDNENEIIDTTFEYVPQNEVIQKENKKTNTFDVSLQIKKPDLLGTSQWELIFIDRKINATIQDNEFLNKVKEGEISFNSNMEINCRLRTEVFFTERQKPTEEKYFIEKVYGIKTNMEHKQQSLNLK